MHLKSIFSSLSGKPSKEPQPQPTRNQCRYILDSGSRCRRQPSVTGSGLCLHHENHILQLRQGESQQLAAEALAGVTDFTSALAVNQVLGRILTLALERRYSPRELDSFTRTLRLICKTQADAAFELRRDRLFPSTNHKSESVAPHSSAASFAMSQHIESPLAVKREQVALEAEDAAHASEEMENAEECSDATETFDRANVAPHSGAASSHNSTSAPELSAPQSAAPLAPATTTTSPNPNSHPSGSDHIIWLGPKPSLTLPHSS